MCPSAPAIDDSPRIYAVTGSTVPRLQEVADSVGPTASSTINFTDNGFLYLATVHEAAPGEDGEQGAPQVSLFGVSDSTGALTGIVADNIGFQDPMPESTVGLPEGRFAVTLNMSEPLQASVRFVFDVNANAVTLVSTERLAAPEGLDFGTIWCVTKNGGSAILPVLITSLPALVGGPAAFLAAVVAKLPGALINTAQAVIQKCFS